MKKVLNVMLVILLIVSVVSVNAFAAGSEFGITVSATSVNPGDTVTVELLAPADGLQDVSALALGITFDNTKVEMTTRSSADIKAAYLATFEEDDPDAEYYGQTMTNKNNANKNGVVTIATTNANLTGYDIPGEAVLLKAVFKVKDDAVGAITFGVQAATVSVYVDGEPANVVSQYSADATAKTTVICEHPSYAEVAKDELIASPATCEDDAVYYKSCSVCGEAGTQTFVAKDTAKGHDWGEWKETTAPTCSAKGEETRVCANDADHKEYRDVAIKADAHTWGEWKETTAPTCSAKGEETRVCANDADHKEYRDVEIDETAHAWGDWSETTAPTCSAKGEETRVCANDANHTDKRDVEIDETAHAWGDWSVTTAPTCSAVGKETRTCKNDASHTDEQDIAIDPNAHEWGAWTELTAPTCCEEGTKMRVCLLNQEGHKENGTIPVDPSAHSYNAVVTEPTCTEQGYTTYTCQHAACGVSYVDDYVDAKGHTDDPKSVMWSWERYSRATCITGCGVCGTVTRERAVIEVGTSTAKDCTEVGKTTYVAKATVNGVEYTDEKTVEGAAGPHDWSDWTVTTKPTCTADGEEIRVCNHNSAHKETNPVAATGHDHKGVVTEPTCTDQGYTTYTCANGCGDTYVADYVTATGHNHEAVVTAPTCTEQGYTTYTCANGCGDTYIADYVAATGHTHTGWTETKAPTCSAKGEELGTCACGDTTTREIDIDPDAHNYDNGTVTTPATCEADGVMTFTCQNDSTHTYPEAIPALGHEFDLEKGAEMKYDGTDHWIGCAREGCDATDSKEAHTVGEDGEEATCQAAAVCGTCGQSFGEADPDAHEIAWAIGDRTHSTYCDNEGCDYETEPEPCTFEEQKYFEHDEDFHFFVCDVCESAVLLEGEKDEDRPGYGQHEWTEWETIEAPTATREGYASRECTVCGAYAEKTLPALGGSNSGSDKDNSNIPDTGDDSPIALMAVVLTVCTAGVVVLTSKKRKNEN